MEFTTSEFELLISQSPALYAVLDNDGIILKATERWAEQFDLPLDKIVGHPIVELVAEADRESVQAIFTDLFVSQRVSNYRFRFVDYALSVRTFQFYLCYDDEHVYLTAQLVTQDDKEHRALAAMSRVAKTGAWYYHPGRDEEFWSEECLRIHELEPDAVVSKESSLDLYTHEYRQQLTELMERLFLHKEGYDFTGKIKTPNGNEKWVRTLARPVIHHDKLIYVNGVCSDVTERQMMLEDLIKKEETQRLALMGIKSGVFDFHISEGYVHFGPEFSSMLGIKGKSSQLASDDFDTMIHPEDLNEALKARNSLFGGKGYHFFNAYRLKHRSGEYQRYEIHGWIKRDAHGRATRMVGNLINVEDRYQAQLERSSYMHRLEEVIKNGFVNTYLLDCDGYIIQADQTAIKAINEEFHIDDNRPGGLHYKEILPEAFHTHFDEEFEEALRGNIVHREHSRKTLSGKTLWLDVMYKPLVGDDDDQKCVLINLLDISERKIAEETARVARNKMDELNRFKFNILSSLSHEIRTPLNGILGAVQVLRDEVSASEKEELLDAQQISSNRLLRMLNNIISLSDIETDKGEIRLEEIRFQALLESTRNEYQLLAEQKGLEFIYNNSLQNAIVKTNQNLVSTALGHLLDNAIKYTSKGSVSLSIDSIENMIVINVSDTGIGIDKSSHAQIFDVFQQEGRGHKWNYDGTGIGLSVAQRFVELLDGRITLKSAPGKGSTFTILLPGNGPTKQTSSATAMADGVKA